VATAKENGFQLVNLYNTLPQRLVVLRLTCPVKFFRKKTSVADLTGELAEALYTFHFRSLFLQKILD